MKRPRPVQRRGRLSAVLAATAAMTVLAGCASGSDPSAQQEEDSTIDYALPAGVVPNWILPISTPGHTNSNVYSIVNVMWEPLISYNGSSGKIEQDTKASIAEDVAFSADGTAVTITMKDRTWSDGEPLTTRDVEFWFNLVKNNKEQWARYRAGAMPDNVTSFTVVDDKTFTMTFDRAYNQDWLLSNNQLNEIAPIPYHAWAKTGDDEEVDPAANLDRTEEGAKAIFSYLIEEATDVSGYADNPLWDVTSGPYDMTDYTTNGQISFTKNEAYDGEDAASITTVNLLPFTSVDAEENAVRSGSVDYGYISSSSLDQESAFTDMGYTVEPWQGWSVTYMPYNFNNPEMGAVFSQLYVRQAIQHSIDQENITEVVWNGAATEGYGPIPSGTESDFISDQQKENPYPYDTEAAQTLLTDHGWTIGSDGIAVCEDAGSGETQCGEGIAAGTKLEMTVVSQTGSTVTDNMMTTIQSSLAEAGIGFSITSAPADQVLAQTPKCEPTAAECSWDLSFFGTAGSWYYPSFPSGDQLFSTTGGANFGSYSDARTDELITASRFASDNAAIQEYSAKLAEELPVIWLPSPDYQVSVINSDLKGVTQDPVARFHPQRWSW